MRSILLVENDPLVARMVTSALLEAGLEVKVATDQASALELLDWREFDAVAIDFDLPAPGGAHFMERVKELKPSTPVVLTTAYPLDFIGLPDGAVAVAKPYRAAEVIRALEQEQRAISASGHSIGNR